MKKFIIILLILISCAFTIPKATDLEYDLVTYIHEVESDIMQKTGMVTGDAFWCRQTGISKGERAVYAGYVEKDIKYIYYAASTGPNIKVCWSKNRDKNLKCSKVGRRTLIGLIPKTTGEYWFYVYGVGNGSGEQVSYMTYLYYEGEHEPMRQEDYYGIKY